jgi:peptidoglycan/LPS O-acetylase OafA/YrhL
MIIKYRPEIDGLRALAVLPVILFHAGLQIFSGGFVGVDIFFVISGYLITSIIIDEKKAGTFTLSSFYERRARRILPALFFVMFTCLPFAWFWLNPRDIVDFAESMIAVVTFSSNIFFWHETGYFQTVAELKPLLHTWSLGVEEQFYLVFPIFLMLTWRFGKRWVLSSLVIVFILSLGMAQWLSVTKPAATFFLLPTRGWELLIGAFIAFYLADKSRENFSHSVSHFLSLAGLLLIIYSIFAFDRKTPFPSIYTLVPTVGAALVILFSTKYTLVGKLLGSRLFVGLGMISYSTYLWHQPLFAFSKFRGLNEPGNLQIILIVGLAIVLAYFSWKYIEKPFRDRSRVTRNSIFIYSSIATAIIMAIGSFIYYKDGFQNRYDIPDNVLNSLKGNTLRSLCDKYYDNKGWDINFCLVGDKNKSPSIAVFGDSHSNSLLPAFDSIGKIQGLGVAHIGLGGCPPLLDVDVLNGVYELGVCKNLAQRQFEFVKKNGIKKVFLVARWTLYTEGEYDGTGIYYLGLIHGDIRARDQSRKLFEEALKRTLIAYKKIGVNVFIVEQIPLQKVDPYFAYYKVFSDSNVSKREEYLKEISIPVSEHNKHQKFTRYSFLQYKGISQLVDLDKVFCNEMICSLGSVGKSFYENENHISNVGALMVVNELSKHLAN